MQTSKNEGNGEEDAAKGAVLTRHAIPHILVAQAVRFRGTPYQAVRLGLAGPL